MYVSSFPILTLCTTFLYPFSIGCQGLEYASMAFLRRSIVHTSLTVFRAINEILADNLDQHDFRV
jgi:hypothetical protein